MRTDFFYVHELPSGKLSIREKILKNGSHSASDIELLAAIIGSGNKKNSVLELARQILEIFDTAHDSPDIDKISTIQGMGPAQTSRVIAAYELGKRMFGTTQKKITGPRDIWETIRHLANRTKEQFICCTLNGAQAIIATHIITIGIINKTIVHPREIFAEALRDRACAIIVAHNHPSGRLEASTEDIEITKRIEQVGDLVGIPLLDHIIFSEQAYLSLKEQGYVT